MKIEKISDIQIKCTLNKQDLVDRELRISELAYGSEKARALFSELLLQASYECGFEAQDVPLMIEAVPMSKDSLVLILTKVTDPEELNVNYSNISMPAKKNDTEKNLTVSSGLRADEIIQEAAEVRIFPESDNLPPEKRADDFYEDFKKKLNASVLKKINKSYLFDSLGHVIKLANVVSPIYHGENTLYKIPENGRYCLLLFMGSTKPEQFNKVCNICAEYGEPVHTHIKPNVYFDEHYEPIIKRRAIQRLTHLSKH